jgi:diguanylate cyclase (GGDEF)-like protein
VPSLKAWLGSDVGHRIAAHQRHLVRRALFAGVGITLFFALVDAFVTGYGHHALAEGATGLCLLAIALLLGRRLSNDRAAGLGIIVTGLLILFVVLTGRAQDGVVVWLVGYPAIPLFLLGRRTGLVLSVIFLVAATVSLSIAVINGGPQDFTGVAILNTGGAMVAITTLAYLYEVMRARNASHLAREAKTDPLTGLLNRRGLLDAYPRELASARRSGRPLSLLVLDLDHFKRVNDTHGHDGGDLALQSVVETTKGLIRDQDWPARVGGEEFAVLLPNTNLTGAREVAEKIRAGIAARPLFLDGQAVPLTVSIGVAQADRETEGGPEDFDALFVRADRRLYRAKAEGRNRVVWDG